MRDDLSGDMLPLSQCNVVTEIYNRTNYVQTGILVRLKFCSDITLPFIILEMYLLIIEMFCKEILL